MRKMICNRLGLAASIFIAIAFLPAENASALAGNSLLFCATYPTSGLCASSRTACATCHAGGPPALNLFGAGIKTEISTRPGYSKTPRDFELHLESVLFAIEDDDSDNDGFTNRDEIIRGLAPGNPLEFPMPEDPGVYDHLLALRRLSSVFCGVSPTYTTIVNLQQTTAKQEFLHAKLAECLSSPFWLQIGLYRLADDKIRPVGSLGGLGNQALVGDFNYDYRLFSYVMSGDRDTRDLLKADYHITADGRLVRDVIGGRGGQPLQVNKRAGLLTTQWFIGNNTMFALLPRNTAAQAYRSYLGLDIARSEGLHPIVSEPRDLDQMGVAAPDCAVCHSTLDPLAYPFTPYLAFASRRLDGSPRPRGIPLGGYDGTNRTYEAGYLMGKPVNDLLAWASEAAETDEFKKTLAAGLYHLAVGHDPQTLLERQEFEALWRALPADGYSANKLIHRLIDTRSFGAPGPSSRPNVVWKRHKQIANDLARALEFGTNEVCKEVGTYQCTDQVFLTALGGNDPINKSQYKPAGTTSAMTPIALERVVLSACSLRVEEDLKAAARVFKFIDLTKGSVEGDELAVDRQTSDLYQRLHGRLPNQSELMAVRELMVDDAGSPVTAAEFAKLACFIIGSSKEFLFN